MGSGSVHGKGEPREIATLAKVLKPAASKLSAVLVNGDDLAAVAIGDFTGQAAPMLREILALSGGEGGPTAHKRRAGQASSRAALGV